jgi:predicted GNAT family N-acyltransferase|tara:strand:- start:68 stop:520 length:453 start_codon:yes stop_codon:yes gene_type:complete
MDIDVKIVKSPSEKELVLTIRKDVFIRGLNIPEHLEIDENEDVATYVLAYIKNNPVGTARWRKTEKGIKLERFAVLDKYRSNGIGAKITKFILNNLKETQPIYLFAQESAIKFYEKLGFKSIGNLFEEVGIKHQKMIYDLEGNKADLFPS